jgi:hypothetical protein
MDRRGFLKTGSIAAVAGIATNTQAKTQTPPRHPVGSSPRFLILACDGGGIRGYLSSLIMQKLNEELNIFSENNQGIDLYAGTSTGGLIALGLAYGKTVDSIVTLYQTEGAQIFNPLSIEPHCFFSQPRSLRGASTDFDELVQVKYNDIGRISVRSVIENFIPGDPALNSLSNKVMVTTFQLDGGDSWNPLIIDNMAGGNGGSTQLYDAALSTAAAPVYFPPYFHPTFGWCSDGGLFANNPAPQALARAIETGVALTNVSLLSIGTGFTASRLPVTSATRLCFGLDRWAYFEQSGQTPPFPLLNGIMDGVSATNDYLCSQLLGSRYLRINPALPEAVALDDYSPATLQMFVDTAGALFASEQWGGVVEWVKANFQR